MKTLTWKSKTGRSIELKATCKTYIGTNEYDLDGYMIPREETITKANLELYVDGKKIDSCNDTNFWNVIESTDGSYKKIWGLSHKVTVALDDEQAELVQQFLDKVIEDGKEENVKEKEEEDVVKALVQEIKSAEEIVKQAEKQGPIMTATETAKYLRNYNNLYNEGEEGYLPEMITLEEYEAAKAVLANKGSSS